MCSTMDKKEYRVAPVVANISHNDEIFTLVVRWEGPRAGRRAEAKTGPQQSPEAGQAQPAPRPQARLGPRPQAGQFYLLRSVGSAQLLARPISIAGIQEKDGNILDLSFMIARRGRGTEELGRLSAGDNLEILGPLGSSWLGVAEDILEKTSGKPLALIGGGIGIAPLLELAQELPAKNYDFFAGFRSCSFGLPSSGPRHLIIASEDGSEGEKGRIPDFLDAGDYGLIFACGPEPMLRAVVERAEKTGTPCIVSLERRMACGVGACLGCSVETVHGRKRCCVEGPVFKAEEIIW